MALELSPEKLGRLRELTRSCTAAVLVEAPAGDLAFRGTACFIDDRHLLTCDHVIGQAERLQVEQFGGERHEARVVARNAEFDLALLEQLTPPGEGSPVSVLLYEGFEGELRDRLFYVYGYPRELGETYAMEEREYRGNDRVASSREVTVVQLTGREVNKGMSGAPVLDASSGAVVAIMRSSRDLDDDRGGGAIPISRAIKAFDHVRHLAYDKPPLSVRAWRDALGTEIWQTLGKPVNLDAHVLLKVKGDARCWQISVGDEIDSGYSITGRDLGEDVAEVLFAWSRRGRLRTRREVELVGRLLAGALLPKEVADLLKGQENADQIDVRLCVERGNTLADIPWELAAVPGDKSGRFLASDGKYRFVRVLGALDERPGSEIFPDSVRVLTVVSQPKAWKGFPVVAASKWPPAKDISGSLTDGIVGAGFAVDALVNPTMSSLTRDLRDGWHVLHYVGVGCLEGETARLSLTDDQGFLPKWVDVEQVLERANEHGVRMVVLEFVPPPSEFDAEPATVSSIVRALPERASERVGALVVTNTPVHPQQLRSFNSSVYEALGDGHSVDHAVQHGRNVLREDTPMEDEAVFGSFTLIAETPHLRLVESTVASARDTAERMARTHQTPPRTRPTVEPVRPFGSVRPRRG